MYEPRVRIYLLELLLVHCNRLASCVKDQEPRARGALVNAPHKDLVLGIDLRLLLADDQVRDLVDKARHGAGVVSTEYCSCARK